MKRFFNRKGAFAAMFIIMLSGFSIANALKEFSTLKSTLNGVGGKNIRSIKEVITKIDNDISNELMLKQQFIEGYAYLQKAMGKNEFNNFSYVKDDNGFLNYASLYEKDDTMVSEYARRIRRLKNNVESKGTKVMFISPPSKYMPQFSKYNEELDVKNTNTLQDEFLLDLFGNGVDYIDLRQILLQSGMTYNKLFYKTDIHWTSQASFIAFYALVNKIKEKYGMDLDPSGFYCNLKNYNVRTYKDNYLGGMGRDTGINYSGLDDFTLIWPKFPTDFQYESNNQKGETAILREGSFENSLLNLSALKHKSDIYSVSSYTSYLGVIRPWEKIVNKNNTKGPKILFIRDSFSSSMISFLAPLCSEIDMICPFLPGGNINVEDYLSKNKFDYVFIMLYPGNINGDGINFYIK